MHETADPPNWAANVAAVGGVGSLLPAVARRGGTMTLGRSGKEVRSGHSRVMWLLDFS
jgi:hypothetical protein